MDNNNLDTNNKLKEITVANHINRPIGKIKLCFDPSTSTFSDKYIKRKSYEDDFSVL
jgi:replicative DNA helicase